jgi:hypothetical protein
MMTIRAIRCCSLVAVFTAAVIFLIFAPPIHQEKVPVVRARTGVRLGIFLDNPEKFFDEEMIAKDLVPQGAITGMVDLWWKVVNHDIPAGSFVYRHDLAPVDAWDHRTGRFLIALRVKMDSETARCTVPGSRVDVDCIVCEPPNGPIRQRTVLRDVLILAGGGQREFVGSGEYVRLLALHPAEKARLDASLPGDIHLRLSAGGKTYSCR